MKPVKMKSSDENKLIIWNVMFLIFILWFLFLTFVFIIPEIQAIETKKMENQTKYQELETMKKSWVSFSDFKSYKPEFKTESDKTYISSLIKEMDKDFYEKNFINTKESEYKNFIDNKIKQYKENSKIEEKQKITEKVLPYYDDNIKDENTLTDFRFISYIENLVSTFNLTHNNSIWIKNINQLWDYVLTTSDNSLEKGIYEIPLELDLVWWKSSIIDFLHFIENVWKVSINENTKSLEIEKWKYKDNDLFANFKRKKIDSQTETSGEYNIFNNQIADIELIEMKEYIDSSFQDIKNTENGNEFISEIKNNQSRLKYEIKVKLNFYVKGLPKYKIDEFEWKFRIKLEKIKKTLQENIWKNGISSLTRQKLQNIQISINNIDNLIKQKESSKQWFMEQYKDLLWYDQLLSVYEEEIKEIKEIK